MKRAKKRKSLTLDRINDRCLEMVDHLDWLINNEKITSREYGEAMIELGKWATAKRLAARE